MMSSNVMSNNYQGVQVFITVPVNLEQCYVYFTRIHLTLCLLFVMLLAHGILDCHEASERGDG
jgi:hypothetical protein